MMPCCPSIWNLTRRHLPCWPAAICWFHTTATGRAHVSLVSAVSVAPSVGETESAGMRAVEQGVTEGLTSEDSSGGWLHQLATVLSREQMPGSVEIVDRALWLAGLLVGSEVRHALRAFASQQPRYESGADGAGQQSAPEPQPDPQPVGEAGNTCGDSGDGAVAASSPPHTGVGVTLLLVNSGGGGGGGTIGAGTAPPAPQLLPVYRLALARCGCVVDEEAQAAATGLFAIANVVASAEKERQARAQKAARAREASGPS
jgi:hypothetical protein